MLNLNDLFKVLNVYRDDSSLSSPVAIRTMNGFNFSVHKMVQLAFVVVLFLLNYHVTIRYVDFLEFFHSSSYQKHMLNCIYSTCNFYLLLLAVSHTGLVRNCDHIFIKICLLHRAF